ncbi:hypothetical protein FRB99_005224 [Tulasnella sp. 403]|nr:hypothetical protein FRB99_005224 [Tulasnella sp. 403]
MLPISRSERGLPPPAIASSSGNNDILNSTPPTNATNGKKTTFDDGFPSVLRVHWSRFKKRLGNGSALSESLIEVTESNTGSESAARRNPDHPNTTDAQNDDEEVDEIVVDNNFWSGSGGSKSFTQPSERGGATPDKSGASGTHATHLTDGDSVHEHEGFSAVVNAFEAFAYRLRNAFNRFFFTSFYDPPSEAQYRRETYYQSKGLAFWGSLFIVLNWILVCALIQKESMILPDKIFYWAVSPCLCIPLPILVIFDWPRKFPIAWQSFMSISIWTWAAYMMTIAWPSLLDLILLELCGYYDITEAALDCNNKEFVGVFYYTSAFPVIALFALGQNRLMASITGLLNAVLIGFVIRNKQTWIRNTLNFILYTTFLVWIHFQKENAERRLYTVRDRLKVQYRATQQAQVSESKAADSKKRFSSYIFHEVRVPLNTALLAVQNMEASGVFRKDDIEFTALEGSLNMMSKVLNDVLDFNRMDSGRFESVSKPYAFHKIIKSMLVPLQLTADARGLHLIIELDPKIDIVARTALYEARGEKPEWIKKILLADDEESGLVVGDEHRLRQILTNLASNACKFTPAGGKIYVRTKLILPDEEAGAPPLPAAAAEAIGSNQSSHERATEKMENLAEKDLEAGNGSDTSAPSRLSARQLQLHNNPAPLDRMVIRIEVEDTGVGIRRKDMIDNRLFSPYVQTDIGRFQGGKGTGLGLALSKHIVRLSGGRLGVKSKRNMGSTFWVELAMGVGKKVLEKQALDGKDGMVAQTFELSPATTEAFKAPESEGATPSTILSSTDASSPPDGSFSSQRQPSSAMRQLMEHSGQIDIVPRGHYSGSSVLSSQSPTTPPEAGDVNQSVSTDPSAASSPTPTGSKAQSSGQVSSATTTPALVTKLIRLPMPPPELSFGSGPTSGPDSASPFTPQYSGPLITPAFAAPTSTTPGTYPPLNVLVVDDDGLTRKLMNRMLTRIGCTVETADNGKNALDMVVQARNPFTFAPPDPSDDKPRKVQTPYISDDEPKYDVIFLDNQMPVMSGVEMVKKLRELKRRDFVVGVTGNALKEDQQEYLEAGVDAVLTKPVKETSLRNFLHLADERRRSARKRDSYDEQHDAKPP